MTPLELVETLANSTIIAVDFFVLWKPIKQLSNIRIVSLVKVR